MLEKSEKVPALSNIVPLNGAHRLLKKGLDPTVRNLEENRLPIIIGKI